MQSNKRNTLDLCVDHLQCALIEPHKPLIIHISLLPCLIYRFYIQILRVTQLHCYGQRQKPYTV